MMLDEHHEMISWGYSNITPWHSHREQTEEQLAAALRSMASSLRDPERAIVNVHVPPYGTQLDDAPVLDADLRVVQVMGQVKFAPVGSTAVRDFLLETQPLLGLHGHIHESAGIRRLGRTIAINPGSDYATGALNGALVDAQGRRRSRPTSSSGLSVVVVDRGPRRDRRRHFRGARPRPSSSTGAGCSRSGGRYPTTLARPGLGGAGPASLATGGARGPRGRAGRPAGTRARIAAIGLTGQCPSVCLVDANGRPARRRPDLPRQPGDGRGGGDSRAIRRRRRSTRGPGICRPRSTSRRSCSGCRRTSRRRSAGPRSRCSRATWSRYALTGEMATDGTHAAATLVFDLRRRAWATRPAGGARAPGPDLFPPVRPSCRAARRASGVGRPARRPASRAPGHPRRGRLPGLRAGRGRRRAGPGQRDGRLVDLPERRRPASPCGCWR